MSRRQLLADFDEALGRVSRHELDSDSVEASPQSVVVKLRGEQAAVDRAQYFVDAVAEHEAAVFDRHPGLGAWDELPVNVNDVFCGIACH